MGAAQALQYPLGQAQRNEFDGFWPSSEDEEDLLIDQNDECAPEPLCAAESTAPKEDEKQSEHIDVDDPEPAKLQTLAVDKPNEDVAKSEDEQADEHLAKNAKEDVDKKADDEAAQKKPQADAE